MSEPRCYRLQEWSERRLPERQLSPTARRLVEKLQAESSRRVLIEELRDGIRIQTFAHVGVVNLGDFIVQIEPKMIGGSKVLAGLIDYAAGIDKIHLYSELWDSLPVGAHLLDLYVLFFVQSCEDLLRRGLLSGYVQFEDELPVVRGRILVREQLLERFGQIDKIHCRFDERVEDVWENQLLVRALGACRRLVTNAKLGARIRRILDVFGARCSPRKLNLARVRRERAYHRMNSHYRGSHELAILLLDALGIDDSFDYGSASVYTFLLDMNRLFERFVSRLLQDTFQQTKWSVDTQHRDTNVVVNYETGRSYSSIRPDILLKSRQPLARQLPMDVKYKLYENKKISTGDIYQLSTYAQAFSSDPEAPEPSSILLFPVHAPFSLQIAIKGPDGQITARIRVHGIEVERVLAELLDASVVGLRDHMWLLPRELNIAIPGEATQ